MKFRLTFNTPDVFDQLVETTDDQDELDVCTTLAESYVEYGEYITIEFDTARLAVKAIKLNQG